MRALLSAWLIAIAAVCAADDLGAPVFDWPAGESRIVVSDGERFFVGAGAALVMAAATPAGELEILGHSREVDDPVEDADTAGSRVVILNGFRLSVFEPDPPNVLMKVGEVDISNADTTFSVSASEDVAVVHWSVGYDPDTYREAWEVIDLSNPSSPLAAGRIEPDYLVWGDSNRVIADHFFLLTQGHLHVYDLSSPAWPVHEAEVVVLGWQGLLAAHGDMLVVGADDGILLVDVSEPTIPIVRATYQPTAEVDRALWVDDLLLLGGGGGFEVVDVGSSAPTRLARLDGLFVDDVRDMTAAGDLVLVLEASYSGHDPLLHLIDVSDPSEPIAAPPMVRPDSVYDVAAAPGRVAAITSRSLWLLDRGADGAYSERLAAALEWPEYVDLVGELAFVGRTRNDYIDTDVFDYRLMILDVSSTGEAQLLSQIDLENDPERDAFGAFQVAGSDWVAVALTEDMSYQSRLELVSVVDPEDPIAGASLTLWDRPQAMTTDGDLVFLIVGTTLVIVDVSDVLHPRQVGFLELGIGTWYANFNLTVWGRYLFAVVADRVWTIDVGVPDEPVVVGTTPYEHTFRATTAATAGRLFVLDQEQHWPHEQYIDVVDVSAPENPTYLQKIEGLPCRIDYPGYQFGIRAAEDDGILVSGGSPCGVSGLDITEATPTEEPPSVNFTASPPFPVVGAPVRFVDHSTGEPTSWSWSFGDGTISSDPIPTHVYTEPGTYTVALSATNPYGSSQGVLTIEVADPTVPPAADFGWLDDAPSLEDPVVFVDASTGWKLTWWWDFGDGWSSHDSDPSHWYSLPGDYEVTLEVTNPAGSSSVTKVITVAPVTSTSMDDVYPDWVIPAAAAVSGRNDTRWTTDLSIHSASTRGRVEWISLHYLERDRPDNFWSPGTRINLYPGQTIRLDDVVGNLFGMEESAGALLVAGSSNHLMTSRTSTPGLAGGSYGQAVPSRRIHSGPAGDVEHVILGLRENRDFRTNLGVTNLWSRPLSTTIDVFNEAGDHLGAVPIDLGRYGVVQIDRVLDRVGGGDTDRGYAIVNASVSQVDAYASVVDNRTGDAVLIPAQRPAEDATPDGWLIPAVASVGGVNGTRWRSQLELFNPADDPTVVTVTLLPTDHTGASAFVAEITVEPRHAVVVDDVVHSLFGLRTSGALVLESATVVHATSRTFTVTPGDGQNGGTFGQHIPAIPLAELLTSQPPPYRDWQLGVLPALREDTGFRSNVGLVNPTDSAAAVLVEAMDAMGAVQASMEIDLAPWQHRQLDRVLLDLGGLDEATVRVTVQEGSISAYASVVDNTTGDPVFINALTEQWP